MKLFFAQLRNILTAFAVGSMSAVVLVAPAGMGAAPASAADNLYVCHATSNADSPEEVSNWQYRAVDPQGALDGHAGVTGEPGSHQNGMDIIPPIPELDFDGQNWDDYGRQVHALGCKVPVTVSVTFTDNRCDGTTYVAPTMTAPTYEGTTKNVTGSVAPGATVTVTYTAKQGYGIVGTATFTHTYPTEPSAAAYCDQPLAKPHHAEEPGCSFNADTYGGTFEAGVIERDGTEAYVWNTSSKTWVLSGTVVWGAWQQKSTLSDEEYFEECAPAQPAAKPHYAEEPGCSFNADTYGGTFEAGVIERDGTEAYVWNTGSRSWVLSGTIDWDDWAQKTVWDDEEYFEECAPAQPAAKPHYAEEPGCSFNADTYGGTFEAGVIERDGTEAYVWNTSSKTWVLSGTVVWGAWQQKSTLSDEEYFEECAPAQPAAKPHYAEEPGCSFNADTYGGTFEAGVIERDGTEAYVWNTGSRSWVLSGTIDWDDWAQKTVWDDEEYFEECAPAQPAAKPHYAEEPGCSFNADTYGGTFEAGVIERDGIEAYVWNTGSRSWVLSGTIDWDDWAQKTVWDDEEYFEECAPAQPAAKPHYAEEPGCSFNADTYGGTFEAGVIERDGTEAYVWNTGSRSWVLSGTIDWDDWAQKTVWDDEEYFEECAPAQPAAKPHYAEEPGCSFNADTYGGTFEAGVIERDGTEAYVWNTGSRSWVLSGTIDWDDWAQKTVWDDEEYFEECAPVQPPGLTVHDAEPGCDLSQFGDFEAGIIRRTGAQEYIWNPATRTWELEPDTGIAWSDYTQAEDDVYTDAEFFENCAPDQPTAATVDDSQQGCDLSQFGDGFEAGVIRRTGDREYVWNMSARAWELESMSGVSWADWTQIEEDVYTDEEYAVLCSGEQPDPLPVEDTTSGCDLTSFGDFEAGVINRDGLQEYVWNAVTRGWVPEPAGDIEWGAWSQTADDAYTDEEYFANCVLPRPANVIMDQEQSGCDLTEFGEFDAGTIRRTGDREYVWNLAERAWELESMDDVSWADWTQSAEDVLSDEQYFEDCAAGQPAAEIRQTSGTDDSCPLGGTLAWTETFTTEYVWDAELRTWVLGEEGEPVREEELREWSQEKFERLCEVAGEQGVVQVMDHELDADIEVKGVQETAVPTSVDAGLGTTPFTPVGVRRNPLALVALGGGLLLLGAAGRRKGATAVR